MVAPICLTLCWQYGWLYLGLHSKLKRKGKVENRKENVKQRMVNFRINVKQNGKHSKEIYAFISPNAASPSETPGQTTRYHMQAHLKAISKTNENTIYSLSEIIGTNTAFNTYQAFQSNESSTFNSILFCFTQQTSEANIRTHTHNSIHSLSIRKLITIIRYAEIF